jgi:hypothetical protein
VTQREIRFQERGRQKKIPSIRKGKDRQDEGVLLLIIRQIILFVFLWMLFVSSVKIMRRSFRNISDTWRIILPSAIAIIAFIVGYHIYKNIRDIRRYGRELEDAGNKIRRT